jgi:hypothetical protein
MQGGIRCLLRHHIPLARSKFQGEPRFYLNVWGLLLYEDLRRRRAKTSGNEGALGAALWLVGKGKKKRHCVPWPDLNVLQISSISTTHPVSVCVSQREEREM